MEFIHLFKLMGLIVYLEKESILTTNIDSSNFRFLFDGIWIIIKVVKVKDSKDGITSMMIKDDRRTRQMLIFNSPEPDIFFSTWDQTISLGWAEFQTKNIEVTDLFSNKKRFSADFNIANVKNKNSLTFEGVKSDNC